MPTLGSQLDLERCPHCRIDKPTLQLTLGPVETSAYTGGNRRNWAMYRCVRCGGGVIAAASQLNAATTEVYPGDVGVNETIPDPARDYLRQALDSQHSPAGAVMLAASAVDAMLKAKGLRKGKLAQRIDRAAARHLITEDMAKWAHRVRLDANEPRHADEKRPLPSVDDGRRSLDFALALAQFLFVLPARVEEGLKAVITGGPEPSGDQQSPAS